MPRSASLDRRGDRDASRARVRDGSLLLLRQGADDDTELLSFLSQLGARWLNRLQERDDLISAFRYIRSVSSVEADNVRRARLAKATAEELASWAKRLLDANSLAEVFEG